MYRQNVSFPIKKQKSNTHGLAISSTTTNHQKSKVVMCNFLWCKNPQQKLLLTQSFRHEQHWNGISFVESFTRKHFTSKHDENANYFGRQ